MTAPDDLKAALDVAIGIEELATTPDRLGNQWGLRFATVLEVPDAENVVARYDNESTERGIPMISLVGQLVTGIRVAAIYVPPSGNYIISILGLPLGENGINTPGPAGGLGTTSATFVNMGAALTFSFTKKFTDTRVYAQLDGVGYSTVAGSKGQYGCSIGSIGDFALEAFFFNEANTHRAWSGFNIIAAGSVPAGTYTILGRFRRILGTGTITIDDNDTFSLELRELF